MGTEDHIKKVALDLIAKIAPEADIQNLDPANRFRNQFDFDSVDFMNFALGLQEELNMAIPEEDFPQLATLNGCVAYLKSKLAP
ncbi:MAG: acyl carrier protein [Desulfobacterales bacterium]|jgi:acyl carrier protein|nr:acyl carrier protein [Desulfobacterales bacterium]